MIHPKYMMTISMFSSLLIGISSFGRPSSLTLPQTTRLLMISTNENEKIENAHIFMSDEMQVYIEDTDAYSVVYNGKYIRMYERALELTAGCCLNHPNWFIQSVTRHKFKSSPTLGEKFQIHGERCDSSTWNLRMIESSTNPHLERDGAKKIYNTAQVKLSALTTTKTPISSSLNEKASANAILASESLPESVSTISTFTIHRDELVVLDMIPTTIDVLTQGKREIHYMLPLRSVLNLFERARSNFLGGPNVLRRLQTENNLLWVVTSIDDLILLYPRDDEPSTLMLYPGQSVVVKTDAITRRKGMIVEFHQTVGIVEADGNSYPRPGYQTKIATGVVTICAIDSVSGKPTSNIPSYIQKLFER